jgi:ribonucleoside-diphosphate reductase beta chain
MLFAPREYEKAYEYWLKAQTSHWLHTEVQMSADLVDWREHLTESERLIIGNTLKGFTTAEVLVSDYWTGVVSRKFQKPEIQMMATTFAAFETIHAVSYAYLNETLGLLDFDAFLHEPSAKAKIDRLLDTKGKTRNELAMSLAVFSAFTEGVNLFSSFAILRSFSMQNKMKGIGQIIAWSLRDESLHSEAGCWLFRTMMEEYPELWTKELKEQIYEAARLTIQLEDDFIDMAFALGPLPNLDPKDLKQYMRYRCNTKLNDLGLANNWKNIDKDALERLQWFNVLAAGVEQADFFAARNTNYAKSMADFEDIWK